ncbi:MAG: DUF115 domain-containing protein [Treponema sp.]|jgi:hypothetical protein|nr:DUF115 domain-containing protein [Treponema sp.]
MRNSYVFLKARNGETIPAIVLPSGDTQPLHSMVDPVREAERLISTISGDTGFLIFLGLGGGFAPQAALNKTAAKILVIDFFSESITELLSSKDYSTLLENDRFTLLTDPSLDEIKNFITENYKPSLCGGIKTLPLRTRTELDLPLFEAAAETIQEAIENVSSDYSVQAHFGMRWFSNIIRNIKSADTHSDSFRRKKQQNTIKEYFSRSGGKAAIVAAGPSLDQQIHSLSKCKSEHVFIISSDTALPVLLHHGIEPDAVLSMDCQHISYYHFLGVNKRSIPLILDIASPPLLSGFSKLPLFFSSGHPLAQYVSSVWRPFFRLDTSGGNVTYACLSFAESLGFGQITIFGADFAYIDSKTYAKGTYIYPFFEKKQNRFSPAEALSSAFLYKIPFLPAEKTDESAQKKYHETSSLRFYRKKLEEKISVMTAEVNCAPGSGAPIRWQKKMPHGASAAFQDFFADKKMEKSGVSFLEQYRNDIAALPPAAGKNYRHELSAKDKQIFTTILPYAAAIKHREPALKTNDLIEDTKLRCIKDIDRVLDDKC